MAKLSKSKQAKVDECVEQLYQTWLQQNLNYTCPAVVTGDQIMKMVAAELASRLHTDGIQLSRSNFWPLHGTRVILLGLVAKRVHEEWSKQNDSSHPA